MKDIYHSNIIDFWDKWEILLGLLLTGHTDTLTETGNLIDELQKRSELQNEQQITKNQ